MERSQTGRAGVTPATQALLATCIPWATCHIFGAERHKCSLVSSVLEPHHQSIVTQDPCLGKTLLGDNESILKVETTFEISG